MSRALTLGLIVTYVDVQKRKLISLLTNDMTSDPLEIMDIYHKRWAIELLFKQKKQNFPLKYLWRECQCHQDTDLGNVDRQPAAHDNAEEAHTLLELFGVGHNGQDNTDVLCGFLQPL